MYQQRFIRETERQQRLFREREEYERFHREQTLRPSKYIVDLVIDNEIQKNSICPISLELLSKEKSVITNCFHVFLKEHIEYWLRNNNSCPVCKARCFLI